MYKKCFFFLLIFLLPLSSVAFGAAKDLDISAKSAIVIDVTTGKVLYAKNADERRYPASTTKMMTLITALEHGQLGDIVTTSQNAVDTEGSSLWLTVGERLTLKDMLYGMMLVSGNDATVAVAEHISGSVSRYAKLMTEKAHAIGAINTNFVNTSGLPDPNHYSTASDLARIAAYGYHNPMFAEIVSTKRKVMPWAGKDHDREVFNENRLLWLYEGGNGVKTGYTEAAGRCLVSGAQRNNIQLVAVVLDSDRMWEDSMKLLDYGFSQLQPMALYNKGDILKTIRVAQGKSDVIRLVAASGLSVPISEDDKDAFTTVVVAPDHVDAPVAAGQKVGTLKAYYKTREIASVDLVAAEPVERKSFFGLVWGSLWSMFAFFLKNFA